MKPIKLSIVDTTYTSDNKTYIKCTLKFKLTSPVEYKDDSKIFTIHGIARLNKGDVFDPVLGSKIALAKAERKAYRMCANVAKEELRYMHNIYKAFDDFCFKAKAIVEHNTNYIKELVK